jgi:hypothetical protein
VPGVPDRDSSVASASLSPVWANNDPSGYSTSRVTLTLMDACGLGADSLVIGRPSSEFTIVSDRNGGPCTETSSPDRCRWDGESNGQYSWVVGTSAFTVHVSPPAPIAADWTSLQHPAVEFKCVTGAWDPGYMPELIQFVYTNPVELGTVRRLYDVNLDFAPSVSATGPFTVTTMTFGSDTNVIWNGPQVILDTTPLHIGPGDWSGSSRTIAIGQSWKPLQFYLGYVLSGSGVYTLTAQWDDGAGNNICTFAAMWYP